VVGWGGGRRGGGGGPPPPHPPPPHPKPPIPNPQYFLLIIDIVLLNNHKNNKILNLI